MLRESSFVTNRLPSTSLSQVRQYLSSSGSLGTSFMLKNHSRLARHHAERTLQTATNPLPSMNSLIDPNKQNSSSEQASLAKHVGPAAVQAGTNVTSTSATATTQIWWPPGEDQYHLEVRYVPTGDVWKDIREKGDARKRVRSW